MCNKRAIEDDNHFILECDKYIANSSCHFGLYGSI